MRQPVALFIHARALGTFNLNIRERRRFKISSDKRDARSREECRIARRRGFALHI